MVNGLKYQEEYAIALRVLWEYERTFQSTPIYETPEFQDWLDTQLQKVSPKTNDIFWERWLK